MHAKTKLMKTLWYPHVHKLNHEWFHGLESAVVNQFTIYPLMMYDEGIGTPSAQPTNPEHTSFSVSGAPNCFVGSKVDNIFCEIEFALTKGTTVTDNIPALKLCFMPIFLSFKNDYIAIDELSSLEVQDVLEYQTEATDRQGFPLYNTVKMIEKYSGSATLSSLVPGLT